MTREIIENTDYMKVADDLYRHQNPNSKMNTPNSVYETTHKWFKEWANTNNNIELFDWILKTK